jgi:hypothetical protein
MFQLSRPAISSKLLTTNIFLLRKARKYARSQNKKKECDLQESHFNGVKLTKHNNARQMNFLFFKY